jgi:hypothetical protein
MSPNTVANNVARAIASATGLTDASTGINARRNHSSAVR